jgi:hypothetical protein
MIGGDPTLAKPSYVSFMADYGTAFRTFKHGLLRLYCWFVLLALPIIGPMHYSKMEIHFNKRWFWIVCLMLMGGIICAWDNHFLLS